MKIIRNNTEIELTEEEIEQAYRQQLRHYHAEDVKSKYEEMYEKEWPGDDEDAEVVAENAERGLSCNDSYWDSYWCSFEIAIENFFKEEV